MYKLMIVEDEPLIRAGLLQYFPWEELGVGPVLEAENGKEGVRLALLEQPDMIITDIRMPELDGLSMIEKLRPKLPDTLFIILTGYNEFHYAQRALKLGNVKNYLLKPLEYEESMATLRDCLDQLRRKASEASTLRELEGAAHEHAKLQYDTVVQHLLEGADLETTEFQPLLELEAQHYHYVVLAAACTVGNTASSRLDTLKDMAGRASDLLEQLSEVRRVMTYYRHSKLYALVAYGGSDSDEALPGSIQEAWEQTANDSPARIYLSIGGPVARLSLGGPALKSADKALYLRYFHTGQTIFLPDASALAASSADRPMQLRHEDKQALAACLEQGDRAAVEALMHRLAEETKAQAAPVDIDQWLACLQELMSLTLRFAHKHGIPVQGVYNDKVLSLAFADDFGTADELFAWVGDWILQVNADFKACGQRAPLSDNHIFESIETYIRQHLDEEITLQTVADRFFYNPSYLSRLFKIKMNKNYMSFVTEIRIQAAQLYLRDPNYLVTDVCGMCGYKSYKHFVKTFRIVTGMTPTDYRKGIGL